MTSQHRAGAQGVLHHRRPSLRTRAFQPVIAKQGSLFLLCTDSGDIPADTDAGLYFHDMRYLSAQSLRLDERVPLVSLLADVSEGNTALFELTNPDLRDGEGHVRIPKETLGIKREKRLGDDFAETVTIENYGREEVEVTLHLSYAADFADMFVVRGMEAGKRGLLHEPHWQGSVLTFQYDGADRHTRSSTFRFSRPPDVRARGEARYHLRLEGRASWELQVTGELRDEQAGALEAQPRDSGGARLEDKRRARVGALGAGTQVETSNPLFNAVLARSFLDLHMLFTRERQESFYAAGVPWYVALFGRDSVISAIELAACEPEVAANTLRVLARHQGRVVDDFRDEQPGKILHELRVDEMANLGEVPQTPYYGSVDSTPLFLVLLGIYSSWTGSLDVYHELHEHVTAALGWIDKYGDSDGDGLIDYQTRSPLGGRNQGWKDSGNAVVMEDGTLAEPPIALPEVQGLVYRAWLSTATLLEQDGDAARAQRLRERAGQLYQRFNEAFWLPDEQYYAFCRQGDGRFSKSIASNGAHALWTGIIAPQHAEAVVRRVVQPDMFNGWGIRTLSALDVCFNPIDYQVGSVWPHDNALIAAGMQRYGYRHEASLVLTAMMEAATKFEHFRLPELFAGHDRAYASKPVNYPVACSPQAWAAGALPFMLAAVLGLCPNGFERVLEVRQASLPDWLDWVELRGLRIAEAEVDLRFERSSGRTRVAILRQEGELKLVVTDEAVSRSI